MAVNIEQLCSDAESLIGKARYTDRGAGESECTNLKQLQTGKYTTMCAGLIVAICKAQGLSVYNGTNTMWRQYLTDSGYITDGKPSETYPHKTNGLKSSQLQKGMMVFKWSSSGEPSKYTRDGLGNYQHVGIVTSVNPLRIVHSTSESHKGVAVDTKIGKFCAWGKLKGINYEIIVDSIRNEPETTTEKEGTSMTGGKLITNTKMRIRAGKGVTSKVLGMIPEGKTIEFTGDFNSGWVAVEYNGVEGFMCTTKAIYATLLCENTEPEINDEAGTLEERLEALELRVAALEEALG